MENVSPSEALNSLHPLLCALVISISSEGKPSGLTASWFTQTSSEPPLVSVAIGKKRATHDLIKQSKEFVIAIPNKDLEDAVLLFGTTSGRDTDKFKESGIQTAPAKYIKVPLVADATINHECRLVDSIDTGDHTIFIGEVVASWANKDKKVLMNWGKINGTRTFEEF